MSPPSPSSSLSSLTESQMAVLDASDSDLPADTTLATTPSPNPQKLSASEITEADFARGKAEGVAEMKVKYDLLQSRLQHLIDKENEELNTAEGVKKVKAESLHLREIMWCSRQAFPAQLSDEVLVKRFASLRDQIEKIVEKYCNISRVKDGPESEDSEDDDDSGSDDTWRESDCDEPDNNLARIKRAQVSPTETKLRLRAAFFKALWEFFFLKAIFGLECESDGKLAGFEYSISEKAEAAFSEVAHEWRVLTMKCAAIIVSGTPEACSSCCPTSAMHDWAKPLFRKHRDPHWHLPALQKLCDDATSFAILIRGYSDMYKVEYPEKLRYNPKEEECRSWTAENGLGELREGEGRWPVKMPIVISPMLVKYPQWNRSQMVVVDKAHVVFQKITDPWPLLPSTEEPGAETGLSTTSEATPAKEVNNDRAPSPELDA